MKTFLTLLLVVNISLAQHQIDKQPTICPKTITTAFQEAGNDTIYATTDAFDSVAVGAFLFGPGIKIGTTVTVVVSADTIVISDTCTTTQDSTSFQIGILRGAAYASGDWLGFPFDIGAPPASGRKLISAQIIDDADVIGATDIIFYSNLSQVVGGSGLDNTAVAELAVNEWYILGIVSLTTTTDLGAVKMLTKDDINLQLPGGAIWARLVAKSSQTYTAMDNLRVRLRFQ